MKTLKKLLLIITTALVLIPQQAFAAYVYTDMIPASVGAYVDFNLKNIPLLSEDIKKTGMQFLLMNMTGGFTHAEEITALLQNMFIQNQVSAGIKLENETVFIVTPITQIDWNALMDLIKDDMQLLIYKSYQYYAPQSQNIVIGFANINNRLVIANKESFEELFDAIDSGATLDKSSIFTNIYNEFFDNRFLSIYFNASSLAALFPPSDKETPIDVINKAAKQIGFSAAIFDWGASFKTSAVKNTASTLDLTSPFTPLLYKYATVKNPLIYAESADFKKAYYNAKTAQNSMGGKDGTKDFRQDVLEETGIDIEKDLIDLFNAQYSITIENNKSSALPYIALMANVSSNPGAAKTTFAKIADKLDAIENPKEVTIALTRPTAGSDDYSVKITLTEAGLKDLENENPAVKTFFPMDIKFGVTADNIIYLSNNPDFLTKYGTGADPTVFGDQISKNTTNAIAIFDLVQLKDYIKNLINFSYAALSTEEKAYIDNKDLLGKLDAVFKPWKSIVFMGNQENNQQNSTWKFLYTSEVYTEAYWQQLAEWLSAMSDNSTRYNRVNDNFKDVPKDVWYGAPVKEAYVRGYVNGYEGGVFQPGKPVTRAEFLKMLSSAIGEKESLTAAYFGQNEQQTFSDTSGGWYSGLVESSAKKGLVSVPKDKKFNPNAPIARAEAIKMIENALKVKKIVMPAKKQYQEFQDVSQKDWYHDTVKSMYEAGLTDGVKPSMFAPKQPLTRAEAVKLILQISKLIK